MIWNAHPFSVYARAETTFIDGVVYFDREQDLARRPETREGTRYLEQADPNKPPAQGQCRSRPSASRTQKTMTRDREAVRENEETMRINALLFAQVLRWRNRSATPRLNRADPGARRRLAIRNPPSYRQWVLTLKTAPLVIRDGKIEAVVRRFCSAQRANDRRPRFVSLSGHDRCGHKHGPG